MPRTWTYPGWKAFDDDRNRYAIIADYLDGAMEPFRQFQYDYYRKGLDEMANNAERGRTEITTSPGNRTEEGEGEQTAQSVATDMDRLQER